MRLSLSHLLLAPVLAAAAQTTTAAQPECTATGHAGYFDLRPDIALPKGEAPKKGMTADYHSNGWDLGYNFTLNICGALVEPVEDVVGVDEELWGDVSGYYTHDGDLYSIGTASKALHARGRKLVLQYTDGSPCGPSSRRRAVHSGATYAYKDYDDDPAPTPASASDSDEDKEKPQRKSTTISFLCDHEATAPHASVHFVAASPDQCAYFFEARSRHACASAEPRQPGSVGPGGVFALIFGIALVVYFAGGVVYQRTVENARGWRQLPNHTVWQGIWNFIKDFAIIGLSSCARLCSSRGRYTRLSRSPSGWRNRDDENRLIDQLDEEWDD